jgi:hypothetical protein
MNEEGPSKVVCGAGMVGEGRLECGCRSLVLSAAVRLFEVGDGGQLRETL